MRHNGSFLYPRQRPAPSSAKAVWGLRDAYEGLLNSEWPRPSTNYAYAAQVEAYGGSGNVTSINSGTFPVNVGESIAVFVGWYSASVTVTVSDSMGNTYSSVASVSGTGPTVGQWFYTLNVGSTSSSNVVTVTFSSATSFTTAQFVRLTGGLLKQFDTSTSANTTNTNISSPSFNTAAAGIVLAGRIGYNAQSSSSWSGSYSAINAFPTGGFLYNSTAQLTYASATSGITVTETGNSSISRVLAILALK